MVKRMRPALPAHSSGEYRGAFLPTPRHQFMLIVSKIGGHMSFARVFLIVATALFAGRAMAASDDINSTRAVHDNACMPRGNTSHAEGGQSSCGLV